MFMKFSSILAKMVDIHWKDSGVLIPYLLLYT